LPESSTTASCPASHTILPPSVITACEFALAFTRHSGKSKSGFVDELTNAGFKGVRLTENEESALATKQ